MTTENKKHNTRMLAKSIVRYELFIIYNAPTHIIEKEAKLIFKRASEFNDSLEALKNMIENIVLDRLIDSIGYPACNNCINADTCKDFKEDKKACEIYLVNKECCESYVDSESTLINELNKKYGINKNSIREKLISFFSKPSC